jgi:glycosyltransferase involved in cell wall biosynthesis
MRLLIITQKVSREDPVLGFFHRWILEFAKHFSVVTVMCLEKGAYQLPGHVTVLSLGKEEKASRLQYLIRFYSYILRESKNYDAVFVHMNQEYILLAGWLWKLMGKRIYMWRNHHAGSKLTDMAAFFCDKIFCTSKFSYTTKYRNTLLMPVGIDTDVFAPDPASRPPQSILSLGRIAPSKKIHVLIEALHVLHTKNIEFTASIYGDAGAGNHEYYASLVNRVNEVGLAGQVTFYRGITNDEAVSVYNAHEIFVNLSSSGMFDKTIFEAMMCGALSISTNDNLKDEIDDRLVIRGDSVESVAAKLEAALAMPREEKDALSVQTREYAIRKHSLSLLGQRLRDEMSS